MINKSKVIISQERVKQKKSCHFKKKIFRSKYILEKSHKRALVKFKPFIKTFHFVFRISDTFSLKAAVMYTIHSITL